MEQQPKVTSLTDQRDWFERMADDYEQDPRDRQMWRALADEITERLGDRQPEVKEEGLW